MDPVPIGYFPKRRTRRQGWVSPWPEHPAAGFPCPPPVEELCSASHCIARGPDRITGEVGPTGGYPNPAAAWRAVPEALRGDFEVFAYRLLPRLLDRGGKVSLHLPDWEVEPPGAGWERLGFDAVEWTGQGGPGCSPLSCNGCTRGVVLNRYCLVGTCSEGWELALRFSIDQPEPGPYGVVEVWREPPRAD